MLFEIGKSIFILSPELVHFFGLLLTISIVKKVISITVITRKGQNQGLLACTVSAKQPKDRQLKIKIPFFESLKHISFE